MRLFGRKKTQPLIKNNSLAEERRMLAQKRKREIDSQRQREIRQRFVTKYLRIIVVGLIITLVLGLVGIVVSALHSEEVYLVTDISFYGNQRIPSAELQTALEIYKGSSLLTISKYDLSARLKTQFTYLDSVVVSKLLPGKLEVGIVEKVPSSVLINLTGAYLLDQEALVLTVLKSTPAEGITFEQSQIVAGYGDPNSQIVKEIYLSKITKPEDRAKVEWDKVPLAEKEAALREIQQTLASRLAGQLEEGVIAVEASEFKDLSKIFTYDNTTYKAGELIQANYLKVSERIVEYFDTREELRVTEILWQSQYTIRVSVVSGKRFIVSAIDDLDSQLFKLEPIIKNGILNQGQTFDLRGTKIVVK